jgi:hypothetical protein
VLDKQFEGVEGSVEDRRVDVDGFDEAEDFLFVI